MKIQCQLKDLDEYYQDTISCAHYTTFEMEETVREKNDEIRFLKAALNEANRDADHYCMLYMDLHKRFLNDLSW